MKEDRNFGSGAGAKASLSGSWRREVVPPLPAGWRKLQLPAGHAPRHRLETCAGRAAGSWPRESPPFPVSGGGGGELQLPAGLAPRRRLATRARRAAGSVPREGSGGNYNSRRALRGASAPRRGVRRRSRAAEAARAGRRSLSLMQEPSAAAAEVVDGRTDTDGPSARTRPRRARSRRSHVGGRGE